ncbi:MAG: hypothetical protein K2Z81_26005, partial [Cyanobacteria bacterium]|nr:hypothetical protein [Cyanobacteriota bacterium]
VWSISAGLLGARFAYLGLFPLILAFVLFLLPFSPGRASRILRTVGIMLVIGQACLYTVISRGNCRAWVGASEDVRLIRQQAEAMVNRLPANKKLVLLNLPYNRLGVAVFFSTEFLPGILKPPLTPKDISNRIICLDGSPINNMYINRSQLMRLIDKPEQYQFAIWNKEQHAFKPAEFSHNPDSTETSTALPVVALGSYKKVSKSTVPRRSEFANRVQGTDIDSYLISSLNKVNPLDANMLVLNITTQCTQHDAPNAVEQMMGQLSALKESISTSDDPEDNDKPVAVLSWSSQSLDESEDDGLEPIEFPLHDDGIRRTYEIDLSPYKAWLVSSRIGAFRLDLPREDHSSSKGRKVFTHVVRAAYINNQHNRTPNLTCVSAVDTAITGLERPLQFPIRFQYDASKIPGATSAIAEISQPYCEFSIYSGHYRARKRSRHAMKSISLTGSQGTFELDKSVFVNPANYQVRLLATDSHGRVVGQSSDPTTITLVSDP